MRHMLTDATGKVVNVIIVNPGDINVAGGWPLPGGLTATPSTAGNIGDHYDGVSLWRPVALGTPGALVPGTAPAGVQAALPGAPALVQMAP